MLVRDLLRGEVVRLLKKTVNRQGYVEEWPLDQRKPPAPPGCALWLGGAHGGEDEAGRKCPVGVCEVVTTGQRPLHNTFPAYDLTALLGEEHLAALRKDGLQEFADSARVVVREKLGTVDLLMALWKLKGYLDGEEDYMEDVRREQEMHEGKRAEHRRLRKENLEQVRGRDGKTGHPPKSDTAKQKKGTDGADG